MADFPNIKAPSSAPWDIVDPFIEDTYLDGGDSARAQYTAPREGTRTLTWSALSSDDLAALKAFYISQRTAPFNWTDPTTDETASYRFESGGLSADPSRDLPGYSVVTAKIKRIGVLS